MTGEQLLDLVGTNNQDKEATQKFIDTISLATQGYSSEVAVDALLHLAFHVLVGMCE
jgi:hypothetical protein